MMNTHHQKEEVFCRGDESCSDEEDKRSPPGNKLHLLPLDIELETSSATPPSRFILAFTNSVLVKGDAQRLFIFSGEEEETSSSSSSLVANLNMTRPSVTLPHGGFKCTSVHGFVSYCHGLQFTILNPSTCHSITFPCKERECTSLGYDPVDDQFKVLTPVSSLIGKPSFVVHEVITLGRGGGEGGGVVSRSQFTSPPYFPMTMGLSINGFLYYGAWAPSHSSTPLFVCFDVRHERLSFITTLKDVLVLERFTILIEYKGKLAVIVPNPLGRGSSFDRFDLWILDDAERHDWSRQTFELPMSLPFSLGMGKSTTSQGTNKAGEIVFSPTTLPYRAQPFYVFYYNTDTKDMRRVRIHGVADTEEFWSRYELTGFCCSFFLPHHLDSIASL